MKPTWATSDGRIRLYLGDCLEVLPTLEACSVDAVVTDPIYGVSQPGVIHQKAEGKGIRNFDFFENDSPREATDLAVAAFRLTDRLLSAHGSGYAWMGHRQFCEVCIDLESRGWKTRFLVWSKSCPAPVPPGAGWPSGAELCLYWFKNGRRWSHNGKNAPYTNVIDADSYRYGKPGKVDHPTQKPLQCVEPLVEASSLPGDTVLDCFMGSGTTCIPCIRTGRQFVGIEKEPKYFEIAKWRIERELGRMPLFETPPTVLVNRELFE